MFDNQRDSARNIIRRLFGIQGGDDPASIQEAIQLVCEVGRRGEFELLREQGIVPFHANRARTPAAGQNAHAYIMSSSVEVPGKIRYHVIVERVEFVPSGAVADTSVAGFQGTQLGSSNSAIVAARDSRYTKDMLTDFSAAVQVQDGETNVVPPAIGTQIWQGRVLMISGFPTVWVGPVLLRAHPTEGTAQPDQLAFQFGVAAVRMQYTFYGYLVPIAGQL